MSGRSAKGAARTATAERPSPANGVRVAVVGRDRTLREAIAARVAAAGYAVSAGRVERQRSEALSGGCDALVVLASRTDGHALQVLEKLREHQSDACVIVAGPDPGADDVALLLRAGAYDYLTTPIKPGRLEEALEHGLETRRSFIEVRQLSGKLQETNAALARERDNLQHWNRNLVLLNQLAQAMSETLKADEIVRMVQSRLGQIVPFDLLGLGWLKPERVWIHSAQPLPDRELEDAKRAMLAKVQGLPLSGRYADRAPRELDLLDEERPSPLCDEQIVPMMVGVAQVGLMRLERHNRAPFSEHEIELLKIVAGSVALALRNAEAHSHVQNLAMTDGLTNLLNRRAFASYVAREFKESERYGTPLGLIMMDLDHFKSINDRHGHLIGDRMLKDVAALLSRTIRAMDIVTRYGGEEFAIILRRCDLPQAMMLAERIRKRVEQHAFTASGTRIPLTISLGVVVVPDPQILTVDDFIAVADRTLYHAKARGRNRVEVYESAAAVGAGGAGPGRGRLPAY
ncbi:MAG TPA: diguanylate cyclase [Nitrospirales bacterium]|nr:diguanylate cyclase [Nitrospirales bacterium]